MSEAQIPIDCPVPPCPRCYESKDELDDHFQSIHGGSASEFDLQEWVDNNRRMEIDELDHEEQYGPYFQSQRNRRLRVDSYECQVCGTDEKTLDWLYGTDFHVHHVRQVDLYIRANGDFDHEGAHSLYNLITLCPRCHPIVEKCGLPPEVDPSDNL